MINKNSKKPTLIQTGAYHWEILTGQACPQCCKLNTLLAKVTYKHKTAVADCESCNFHGRVPNPNFNYDKK